MGPHWNWDFEDEQRASRMPGSSQPSARQSGRKTRLRRRRLGAAAAATLCLAAILGALLGAGRHGASSSASAPADMHRLQPAPTKRPTDTLEEGERAVSSVLAYTPFVKAGGARARDVALTFDDGPGPYTPAVLSVLERAHAPATFFAIGEMERYFSSSTIRELHDGDVVGDHTETHPELARLSAHDQYEELFEQIARIELLGGPRPRLFRPPYGSFDATTFRELRALHLLMVLWSVDTGDYLQPGVDAIVQRALAGAKPGAIILMHDAGGNRSQTVAALPTLIRDLRARGFDLVTVPQLLADDPPPRGQQVPKSLSGD
ncbi:MAG: polysaccharide deacetylase family protein [Solirubrobacteraceae bacterium]|jgi:peptidoglycan/xylan/chitin deacetylase (PgdA/CDA1 family)